jgi:hypothetical protein
MLTLTTIINRANNLCYMRWDNAYYLIEAWEDSAGAAVLLGTKGLHKIVLQSVLNELF